MRILRLPRRIKAFLFDMDMTLYTRREYARFQIDSLVGRLAELRGLSFREMEEAVAVCRRDREAASGGRKLSLGTIFTAFGISIAESVRWREELYEPGDYLSADPRLREALAALSGAGPSLSPPPDPSGAVPAGKTAHGTMGPVLALVTNNPVLVAKKTLSALGVADLFAVIVGLDTCGVSKPHEAPFLKAAELSGAEPGSCVSVGDRYDIDIALPLELGMGGILVDGVEDVYRLPALIHGGVSCS
jgi:phosphoglycolate phosphatase/putative hydrolase of the HAD superfamily